MSSDTHDHGPPPPKTFPVHIFIVDRDPRKPGDPPPAPPEKRDIIHVDFESGADQRRAAAKAAVQKHMKRGDDIGLTETSDGYRMNAMVSKTPPK